MYYEIVQMDPALPGGFEWEPLSYPATYEEKQSLIVSKIQQLREMTKMKEESCGVPILADAHEVLFCLSIFEKFAV